MAFDFKEYLSGSRYYDRLLDEMACSNHLSTSASSWINATNCFDNGQAWRPFLLCRPKESTLLLANKTRI